MVFFKCTDKEIKIIPGTHSLNAFKINSKFVFMPEPVEDSNPKVAYLAKVDFPPVLL